MDKKQKCESNNQWAGANISLTSQTNVKEKDENKVNKKQIEKIANEKFGSLAGLAQQYLFYWRRMA